MRTRYLALAADDTVSARAVLTLADAAPDVRRPYVALASAAFVLQMLYLTFASNVPTRAEAVAVRANAAPGVADAVPDDVRTRGECQNLCAFGLGASKLDPIRALR